MPMNRKIGTISKKFSRPYEWIFNTGTPWSITKSVSWQNLITLTNAIANELLELKAYWGTEQRSLPSWYTQLEYITLDWDSYFDTWLVVNSFDVIVKSKHSITTENVTPSLMRWYMWNSGNLPRRWIWRYQSYFLWSANSTSGSWSWSFDTNVHEFTGRIYTNSEEQIMREISMDGWTSNSSSLTNQELWSSNILSIYIWARNNNWEAWNFITWDFYNLNLIQNWVCIWNIVPVIRESDMTVWLYNTITNTFFANLWTWTVVAWPNAVPNPEAPIEIISNNWILKVSGNILDMSIENIVLWKYIDNSGTIQDSSQNFYNSKYIPVAHDEIYTRSTSRNVRYVSIMEYDIDKNFIKRTLFNNGTYWKNSWSLTIWSTTAFVLFWSNPLYTDITMDDVFSIDRQFEKSSVPTAQPKYWIYADGTQETIEDSLNNTATAEMLLKVWDYQDEQEILSGNITRKVGIKVFDWTEMWIQWGNYNQFYTENGVTDRLLHNPAYCTHYMYSETNSDLSNKDNAMVLGGSTQRINFSKGQFADVTAFKNWLTDQYNAWTPVIVAYVLATPTTETVTWQTLDIATGTNTIEITQASIDSLTLSAKYKATS